MSTVTEQAIYRRLLLRLAVEDDTIVLCLEPLHGVVLDKSVGEANSSSLLAPVTDIQARSSQNDVEVHAIDTDAGIVPEQKLNG